jgi:hypothetical protein
MSIDRPDIARQLGADMRWLLEEPAMTDILYACGGVIVEVGDEWYVQVGGTRIKDTVRSNVLNRALDLIATRPDLWPQPPSDA